MKRLDEILARAEAATPGLWYIDWSSSDTVYIRNNSGEFYLRVEVHGLEDLKRATNDSEFIAHARTDIPLVVAALKKAMEGLNSARTKMPVHPNLVGTYFHEGIDEQAEWIRNKIDCALAEIENMLGEK